MQVRIEIECSPVEARQFMGLPDVTPLNDMLIEEMKKRTEENISLMAPDVLMRSWMTMGNQAQDAFLKLLTAGIPSKS